MPTKPRDWSESGFYHVFHRGVNRYDIFEDDGDRDFFVSRMQRYAREYGVEIHAWCLMSNHVHLLVRADLGVLSAMMRQLASVYAKRFNLRHGRSGPLFEGRFRSVCVENDAQVMALARYIHRNPCRHGWGESFACYRWSSYREYAEGSSETCDTRFVTALFGSIKELVKFHEEDRDFERVLDVDHVGPMRDDEARVRADMLLSRVGANVPIASVGHLARKLRDDAIALVREVVGCSLRQMQRLTGVPYSAVRVAVESCDPATSEFGIRLSALGLCHTT